MANQTISVSLTPSGDSYEVTYPYGGNIEVNAGDTDTIGWYIDPEAPSGTTLIAVVINNGEPGNVPWAGPTPTPDNNFTTTDTDALQHGAPPVSWYYSVQVKYDGNVYASDPEIKNDPPPMIMRRVRRD